ncbi:HAD-IIA family hydrolase [Amycolatopsis jiangsuensis]|uniref:HAD superfamily hydrolase (TIGR01450 family) n=1 Tax=Amycolatopsis jiangsuensis TaxID=1181879 RepID=A0A840IPN8_9PSEU|nr:HAD-IIA family hydrolase [Amycolatopsis jiangsuensis]MBB4683014.1 HAD superfamily hydrolase (TIGR01450 family) [Amycolatopsis jiangsuensis]
MSDALLAGYDAVLFDLDGTVYHGAQVIHGAPETVTAVRNQGTAVRFVTNNASKAPEDVVAHLRDLGLSAESAEVHTSAQAGVAVLGERLSKGAEVLVVGTESLADEVAAAGLAPVRKAGDGVAAVVQGHSPDNAWADLAEACLAIRAGALWVACNVDATLPSERGLLPGNGSMVAALRTATEAEPVVAGKPQPLLFETAARSAGANRPLVVGDRLDTDIAGAVAAGLDVLCVLTGVATPATLLRAVPAERPTHLGSDLTALTRPAEELRVGSRPGWEVGEGDVLTARGDGDPLDLLRTLCAAAWRTGVSTVRAEGDAAGAALTRLGLA